LEIEGLVEEGIEVGFLSQLEWVLGVIATDAVSPVVVVVVVGFRTAEIQELKLLNLHVEKQLGLQYVLLRFVLLIA
jgi:hypothetical protein